MNLEDRPRNVKMAWEDRAPFEKSIASELSENKISLHII